MYFKDQAIFILGWHSETYVYKKASADTSYPVEKVRLWLGTGVCNKVQWLLRVS